MDKAQRQAWQRNMKQRDALSVRDTAAPLHRIIDRDLVEVDVIMGVVPPQPGTLLLSVFTNAAGQPESYFPGPVVAWAIGRRCSYPISDNSGLANMDDEENAAVQWPDGTVTHLSTLYDSAEDWWKQWTAWCAPKGEAA